jgi:hypothetical protein
MTTQFQVRAAMLACIAAGSMLLALVGATFQEP